MRLTSPKRLSSLVRHSLLLSWWWLIPLVSLRASGDDRGEWAFEVKLGWQIGVAEVSP